MRKVGQVELPVEVALNGTLVCPNCGDTKFGSSRKATGALIRTCHGSLNEKEACTFSWPEEEDHKYFYVSLKDYLKHRPEAN